MSSTMTTPHDPFAAVPNCARHAALAELARHGPLHHMVLPTAVPAWVITGYAEARAALTDLIANGALTLLSNPAEFASLRAHPSRWPVAIEELLRFDSPVQATIPATAAEPVEGHRQDHRAVRPQRREGPRRGGRFAARAAVRAHGHGGRLRRRRGLPGCGRAGADRGRASQARPAAAGPGRRQRRDLPGPAASAAGGRARRGAGDRHQPGRCGHLRGAEDRRPAAPPGPGFWHGAGQLAAALADRPALRRRRAKRACLHRRRAPAGWVAPQAGPGTRKRPGRNCPKAAGHHPRPPR